MFPLGNAARATRWVSLGIGAISCGWSDIAILLGSKDGDQTPSLQTLLASGLCEITLRCLMMPHEIGIGPRLMSCKSEFASSIFNRRPADLSIALTGMRVTDEQTRPRRAHRQIGDAAGPH